MGFNIYATHDDSSELNYIIPDAVSKKAILLCKDTEAVLNYAKEHNMTEGLSVMSYKQLNSVVSLNYPIVIDNIKEFLQYLFPGLEITAWGL